MEIICVEDALLENLFLTAVDLVLFSLLVAISCALLAERRMLMYYGIAVAGFLTFIVILCFSLLTENPVMMLLCVGFLVLLVCSYRHQKKIFLAEEEKKARLLEIEKESKKQAVIKKIADKVRGNHLHFMPRVENNDL